MSRAAKILSMINIPKRKLFVDDEVSPQTSPARSIDSEYKSILHSPSFQILLNDSKFSEEYFEETSNPEFSVKATSLVPYSDSESESAKTPIKENGKRNTRKRKCDPLNWKRNIRKMKVAKGEAYISTTGKKVSAKKLKEYCKIDCFYNCRKSITHESRFEIFKNFYGLCENGKRSFILANTLQLKTKLDTVKNVAQKRNFPFKYFLPIESTQVQVCKIMFLNTLSISAKMVYNAHKGKKSALIPGDNCRGKHTVSKISDEVKNGVRSHIRSFPEMESHYCRKSTSKKYLDPKLNITKMYDLYVESCKAIPPCKLSMYRHIFNNEFNLDFLQLKSDRCDRCEEYRVAKKENRMSEKLELDFNEHFKKKLLMRNERENDKNLKDIGTIVVLFDLQNVIPLPVTEVGVAFYKCKLNVYNLTAHVVKATHSGRKTSVYCAMWTEALCGRSGNDIASALYKILAQVIKDFPGVKKIITWSDSCVPQNRNQIISFAIGQFLQDFMVEEIVMKYSLPGHSCIQEVDNVHSQIEKNLKLSEAWSMVSLIRLMLKVNRRNPFKIIQMQARDFFDFHSQSKKFNYKAIPFFQVSQLHFFRGSRYQIFFQVAHQEKELNEVKLTDNVKKGTKFPLSLKYCPLSTKKVVISKKKILDIKSMYRFMPKVDIDYYESIFPNT